MVFVCVSHTHTHTHTHTQGGSGGKINIFGGDSTGHDENKVHMKVKCKVHPTTGHEGPEGE
jgi:hypothetical protein